MKVLALSCVIAIGPISVGAASSTPEHTPAPRPPAHSWGNLGHSIVCYIAYGLLDQRDRGEVDRLTRSYVQPDGQRYRYFADACTFADKARTRARGSDPSWHRFRRFESWHYLNLPRTAREPSQAHCGGDCILTGIETHAAELADGDLGDGARAEALFFLGHWVGDIHQPLHVSYEDDRGGGRINEIRGGFYRQRHFHAVWDTGIILKRLGMTSWWLYARSARQRITPNQSQDWSASPPLEWAKESYAIATRPAVDYCEWDSGACRREGPRRYLTEAYQQQFEDDVETRILQASVRLSALLRSSLDAARN